MVIRVFYVNDGNSYTCTTLSFWWIKALGGLKSAHPHKIIDFRGNNTTRDTWFIYLSSLYRNTIHRWRLHRWIDERVGAAAVIMCHFQNGKTCRQLSKRLPDSRTNFATEATAITFALNYYRHMEPVRHGVVDYFDSISCLQATEGENTENPLICYILNPLWMLIDKGTLVGFCCIPSHCGIEENERVDQLVRNYQPWHWPTDGTSLCRFEATSQLLHPPANPIQVGRVCAWQRSLSLETNIRSTKEISVPNQGWGSCYHPASNWSC